MAIRDMFSSIMFKRAVMIILIGCLCALFSGIEKYYTANTRVQSGVALLLYEVQFSDPDEGSAAKDVFSYDTFLLSPGNTLAFIKRVDESESEVMKALDSNWRTLDVLKRGDWVSKKIFVKNFGAGKCEIAFMLDANTPKDIAAFSENSQMLLDAFLDVSIQQMNLIKPNASMTVIHKDMHLPEATTLSRKEIVLKYAVAGFFLGCILASAGIFVHTMRKK